MWWPDTLDYIQHKQVKLRHNSVEFWETKPAGYYTSRVMKDLAFEHHLRQLEANKRDAMRHGDPRLPLEDGRLVCVSCRRKPRKRLNRCDACYMREWRGRKKVLTG